MEKIKNAINDKIETITVMYLQSMFVLETKRNWH